MIDRKHTSELLAQKEKKKEGYGETHAKAHIKNSFKYNGKIWNMQQNLYIYAAEGILQKQRPKISASSCQKLEKGISAKRSEKKEEYFPRGCVQVHL